MIFLNRDTSRNAHCFTILYVQDRVPLYTILLYHTVKCFTTARLLAWLPNLACLRSSPVWVGTPDQGGSRTAHIIAEPSTGVESCLSRRHNIEYNGRKNPPMVA